MFSNKLLRSARTLTAGEGRAPALAARPSPTRSPREARPKPVFPDKPPLRLGFETPDQPVGSKGQPCAEGAAQHNSPQPEIPSRPDRECRRSGPFGNRHIDHAALIQSVADPGLFPLIRVKHISLFRAF